jgi:hypothetical protein
MISSIIGRDLMKVLLVVQAAGAIIIGLQLFDVNVFALMTGSLEVLVRPLQGLIGVSGVAGLLELLAGCGSCCE